MNSSLVENESAAAFASHAVAWDSQNRLEFPLPFQDMKPSIYFGECLLIIHQTIYSVYEMQILFDVDAWVCGYTN